MDRDYAAAIAELYTQYRREHYRRHDALIIAGPFLDDAAKQALNREAALLESVCCQLIRKFPEVEPKKEE